jgi:HD-GYP domain-containing protein (c-di-GMP phosphodiesterase class II)
MNKKKTKKKSGGEKASGAEARIRRLKEAMKKLNAVGAALSSEHDLDRLLNLILVSARELIGCDAGSLYLVSPDEKPKELFFKLAQNDSLDIPFKEMKLPISRESIAGYVTITHDPLIIRDVRKLPADAPYSFNTSFDDNTGYQTISMLTLPMCNQQGMTLGVLQLINRRKNAKKPLGVGFPRGDVLPFDADSVDLALSLASQAAVALENSRLLAEIKHLFDSFVHASVTAIESRDPTTSGHSERVARYATRFASTLDGLSEGPYAATKFTREELRQLEYAALLHDFGKIGVREHVLVKANKLYPHELDQIEQRAELIAVQMNLHAANKKLEDAKTPAARHEASREIEKSLAMALEILERDLGLVKTANRPSVLEKDVGDQVKHLTEPRTGLPGYEGPPLIDEKELCRLMIPRGSLSEEERKEIESHVTRSYEYLCDIPWTSNLKRVPEIAYAHHEKLNGHGYPRGVSADQISVETRMLTITDIYDALTAWDRPYKKAVPVEKALAILQSEVDRNAVDADLFRVFKEARVYEAVTPPAAKARN